MSPGEWTHLVEYVDEDTDLRWKMRVVDGMAYVYWPDRVEDKYEEFDYIGATAIEDFYSGAGYTVTKLNKFKGNK